MASPNYSLPDAILALLRDPLSAARAAARGGARVVAYLGHDVPVALILASGALPVRLRGVAGHTTARADLYLESAYAPEHRVIVEQWLCGEFDHIDAVVFPRTDDSAQRLYYYLCELQRRGLCAGPRPLLYDVATIGRPMSLEYTRESTHRLAAELGVTAAHLDDGSRRAAGREGLCSDLRTRRAGDRPLAGSLAWALERASACDWRETFDGTVREWLAGAPALAAPRRILLVGNAVPGDDLHRAIENGGGSAVTECTESEPDTALSPAHTIEAIADQFHRRRSLVRAMRDDARWLVDRARSARAHAVVAWLIEEDESLPWEISRQMRHLESAGIPALLMPRQPWQPHGAALGRVHDFVASVGASQ